MYYIIIFLSNLYLPKKSSVERPRKKGYLLWYPKMETGLDYTAGFHSFFKKYITQSSNRVPNCIGL